MLKKLNFNEKLNSGNFPLRKVSEANFPDIFNTNANNGVKWRFIVPKKSWTN